MKCSRITLFDRKEKRVKKNFQKHPCYYERKFQPDFHNYLSWLNKPNCTYENEEPYLTVCNIVLPKNAVAFVDRGAQSARWVQKRPRLKSGKQKDQGNKGSVRSLEYDEDDDQNDELKNPEEEKDSEIMEIQQVLEEYEIDENVQRLIQDATEYDRKIEEQLTENPNEYEETNKRKQKKHKTKETRNNETKERAKVRLNRTMPLSLSRPPSPETIQVIRVDVTSNYSLEELRPYDDDDDDGDDYGDDEEEEKQNSDVYYDHDDDDDEVDGERKRQTKTGNEKALAQNHQLVDNNASNRLCIKKSLMKIQEFSGELTVQCQKVALANRQMDAVN